MKRYGYFILIAWLALTFVMLDTLPSPWADWAPDYCRGTNCYCEPIRDRLIAQPVATYSNLGFVAAGLFVLVAALRARPAPANPMTAHRGYPVLYGAALTSTGAFSFFYHASLTKVGDYFDLMGMFLFTTFFVLYSLNRLRPMSGLSFVIAYIGLNLVLALGLVVAYSLQQIYFAALVLAALVIEALVLRTKKPDIKIRFFGLALLVFGLGAAVWVGDSNGLLPCTPDSLFQWHGLWHLSAALAGVLMYLYYRSENVTDEGSAVEVERIEAQ